MSVGFERIGVTALVSVWCTKGYRRNWRRAPPQSLAEPDFFRQDQQRHVRCSPGKCNSGDMAATWEHLADVQAYKGLPTTPANTVPPRNAILASWRTTCPPKTFEAIGHNHCTKQGRV